jgi:hypothetical protein
VPVGSCSVGDWSPARAQGEGGPAGRDRGAAWSAGAGASPAALVESVEADAAPVESLDAVEAASGAVPCPASAPTVDDSAAVESDDDSAVEGAVPFADSASVRPELCNSGADQDSTASVGRSLEPRQFPSSVADESDPSA